MRILVTGGAGYIGSVTTELLLDGGHEAVVFDNLERGHRPAVDSRARLIEGDLREPFSIADAISRVRPDAVMHFAAYALVGESMEQPEIYFRNNVVGSINLVEAMLKHGVKTIVFSSTCATYGVPRQNPISEDTPQNPANPYGESKLLVEKILRWHTRLHGLHAVFLRYFNACGATAKFGEDHDPETHLIPNVIKVALGRKEAVSVFGGDYATPDGTCIRDYVHIADLAQAHILALKSRESDVYNLGNGGGFSVQEVIAAAREVTGHPIPARVVPRRPGDPDRLVAASDKARRQLGWQPKYADLRAILRSAWTWSQAHPNGYGG